MPKSQTIFIIDDNNSDLTLTKSYLENLGHNLFTFTSATEALDKMKEISPHLIILDYLMPEMNGDKFMIKVSERLLHDHDWQVYLVTSKQFSHEQKLSMLTLGITHIFEKPLQKEPLLEAITEFLA